MKKAGSATSLLRGADALTEIEEEKKPNGIQQVLYRLGGWQSAMESVGHQGIRLGTTQGSQGLASAHIPASLAAEPGPAAPLPPAGQLGLSHPSWDPPHLWFLLGSPCGTERPPARQGLPHLLRVLSCLETTENHLWGPGRAVPSPSPCLLCRAVQGGGGRRGLSRVHRSRTTKQAQRCPACRLPKKHINVLLERPPPMRPSVRKAGPSPRVSRSEGDCWGWPPWCLKKKC